MNGLVAAHGEQADLSNCQPDWHHAQQVMLNHALLLLPGTTDYVGFFDLDEYFRMEQPGTGLVDMLRHGNDDLYVFQSRWAELPSQHLPTLEDGTEFFEDKEVVVTTEWMPFPYFTKYIARPENILGTGAHVPKCTSPGTRAVPIEPEIAGIYHFHSFSGKASRRNIVNPNGEWMVLRDFLKTKSR